MRSKIKFALFATLIVLTFILPYQALFASSFAIIVYSIRKIKWKIVVPIVSYIFIINYIFNGLVVALVFASRTLFLLIVSSAFTFTFEDLLELISTLKLPKSVYIPMLISYRHLKILERDAKTFQETYKMRFGKIGLRDYVKIYSSLIKSITQKVNDVAVAIYLKEDGIEELVKSK